MKRAMHWIILRFSSLFNEYYKCERHSRNALDLTDERRPIALGHLRRSVSCSGCYRVLYTTIQSVVYPHRISWPA